MHMHSMYVEFVTLIEIEGERECVCAELLHTHTAIADMQGAVVDVQGAVAHMRTSSSAIEGFVADIQGSVTDL